MIHRSKLALQGTKNVNGVYKCYTRYEKCFEKYLHGGMIVHKCIPIVYSDV